MRMMASTIGVFTLMFMYIALLGLPFELSVSFIGFALLPLLFYLCCVLRTDKYRLLFPKGAGGVGKCGDCLRLVLSMLMVAMVVYVTGGAHSSYKLLFLPVALLHCLQYGPHWGAIACSIAAAVLLIFTWRANPGTAAWNIFLGVDLVVIGVLFLVNWLVAKPYQELAYSYEAIKRSREHSRKIIALEEMAAATVHEIKNPLTTLRGCLQMLQQYPPREKDSVGYINQRNYINIMLTEVDRLNRIVANMLLFTQPVEPQIEIIDLNEIVREMGMLLGCRAELNGVELRVNLERARQVVAIDPGQIKQVILNIVGNALEAVPGEGIVSMTVKRQEGWVYLVIGDNGPGIPPEYLGKIFEPFFTAEKEEGTGLGLAISERLIKGNSGSLSVSSEPGHGAIFTIGFPVAGR